ncbi:MAG: T9SS type A sorting domain-containing protein [Crocinitomicaceae bacterium]|nr:T9SS type A sorting domain-containing protein [Crocinitomicaceae bacterium]
MKMIAFLLFISSVSVSLGQTTVQLGGLVSNLVLDEEFKIQTNAQKIPFIAYITQELPGNVLHVKKHEAGQWGDVDPNIDIVDSNVIDFDLKSSYTSDSIFLVYTKSDGVYFRTYNNNWSATSHFPLSPFVDKQTMRMALDADSHDIYCLVRSQTNQNHLLYFSSATGMISELSSPSDLDPFFFYTSDLLFDEEGSQLLACYQSNSGGAVLKTFNGLSWSTLINNLVNTGMYRTMLDQSMIDPESVVVGYTTADSGGYGIGITKGNTQIGSTEVIQAEYNPVTNSIFPLEGIGCAVSPTTDAVIHVYRVQAIAELFYSNGGVEGVIELNMPMLTVKDICFDADGKLYLAGFQYGSGLLYVYTLDSFLALNEENVKTIMVYPTLANDQIKIVVKDRFTYQLINTVGDLIIEGRGDDMEMVSIENLPSKMYYLKVYSEKRGVTMKKIVKQ